VNRIEVWNPTETPEFAKGQRNFFARGSWLELSQSGIGGVGCLLDCMIIIDCRGTAVRGESKSSFVIPTIVEGAIPKKSTPVHFESDRKRRKFDGNCRSTNHGC
jgi:hypothetical protein